MNFRPRIVCSMLLGMWLLAFSTYAHPMPRLLWNASASVPIGLYQVHPVSVFFAGELLIVTPPVALAQFMAARGYLAPGVPLIKHLAALPGQKICRFGHRIIIDGIIIDSEALDYDTRGRTLPVWQGCQILQPHEIFLLNTNVPDSFDGRYFGPIQDENIVGRAIPLWLPKRQ